MLSDYVLGVRRQHDPDSGLYEWVVDPAWEVVEALGISNVNGRVPLPAGGFIQAKWRIVDGENKCEAVVHSETDVRVRAIAPCSVHATA